MKWKIIHAKYELAHVMDEHICLTTCGRGSAEALIARHNANIDELERRISVADSNPGECQECAKWEKKYNDMLRWHDDLDAKLCAVRAALEDEA